MDKAATYDDISEIIKERVDNFELKDNILEEQLSIEEINKMLHDLTEFGMTANYITSINNNRGICIQSIPMYMHAEVMPAVIGGLKHDIVIIDDEYQPKYIDPELEHEKPFPINVVPFYPRNYASKQCLELVDGILFQEEKQPKENHPYGWYRKFEKKRF